MNFGTRLWDRVGIEVPARQRSKAAVVLDEDGSSSSGAKSTRLPGATELDGPLADLVADLTTDGVGAKGQRIRDCSRTICRTGFPHRERIAPVEASCRPVSGVHTKSVDLRRRNTGPILSS